MGKASVVHKAEKNPVPEGRKYNRLKILHEVPPPSHISKKSKARFVLAVCDCGAEKVVNLSTIKNGGAKSCGCLKVEKAKETHTKHGRYKTPEYEIWMAINQRCLNPNNKKFKFYGGKGKRNEWDSFESFLRDMGERPSPNHSIDRIDNNGNYCKENCRWTTEREQQRNTSRSKIWHVKGEVYPTAIEAARANGVSETTVCHWCGTMTMKGYNYKRDDCWSVLRYPDD